MEMWSMRCGSVIECLLHSTDLGFDLQHNRQVLFLEESLSSGVCGQLLSHTPRIRIYHLGA